MLSLILAISMFQELEQEQEACPIVWNAVLRYSNSDYVELRVDKFIGLTSQEDFDQAMHDSNLSAEAMGLQFYRGHSGSGEDCNEDGVRDRYEHIYLQRAPVGFTPEAWAEALRINRDPAFNPVGGHRSEN